MPSPRARYQRQRPGASGRSPPVENLWTVAVENSSSPPGSHPARCLDVPRLDIFTTRQGVRRGQPTVGLEGIGLSTFPQALRLLLLINSVFLTSSDISAAQNSSTDITALASKNSCARGLQELADLHEAVPPFRQSRSP